MLTDNCLPVLEHDAIGAETEAAATDRKSVV